MTKLIGAIAVLVIAAGIALSFTGSHTLRWSPPPQPPKWEAPHPDGRVAKDEAAGRPPPPAEVDGYEATPMPRSVPVSISIPAIKVRARTIALGLDRDGDVAVPSLSTPFLTSWYDKGPTPGAAGAAVVYGHVDARATGPAVFYYLGELRPGDSIYITLKDGRVGLFRVYSAAMYLKTNFPAGAIYDYTSWPSLRLITCGGQFDQATGHYLGNTVVFAQYVGQRAATLTGYLL
jgi:hypothetical protein